MNPSAASSEVETDTAEGTRPRGCAVVAVAVKTRSRETVEGPRAVALVPAQGDAEVLLTARTAEGACAEHPVWRIVGTDEAVTRGNDLSVRLPVWRVGARRWLGAVVPRTVRVAVQSCAGEHEAMEIRTYPADRLSVTFDPTQLGTLKQAFDAVQMTFGQWIDGFRLHYLEGTLKLDAGWEETAEHTAYYRWVMEVGFDPLVGVAGRYGLGPLAVFPRFVREYLLDGGMFVDVVGKVVVGGSVGRVSPGQVGGQLRTEGSVEFGIGIQAHVLQRVARVEISGRTAMTAEAAVVDPGNGEPALGLRVGWGGLRGEMRCALVGGLTFTSAVTLKEPEWLVDKVIPLPLDRVADGAMAGEAQVRVALDEETRS